MGFPRDLAALVEEYAPRYKLREWIDEAKIRGCESVWSNPMAIEASFLKEADIRDHPIGVAANPALIEHIERDLDYYICRVTAWANPLLYERLIARGRPSGLDWHYLSSNTHPAAAELILSNQRENLDSYRAHANPAITEFLGAEICTTTENVCNSHPSLQSKFRWSMRTLDPLIKENGFVDNNVLCVYKNLIYNYNEWVMQYVEQIYEHLSDSDLAILAQNPSIFEQYRCDEYIRLLMGRP